MAAQQKVPHWVVPQLEQHAVAMADVAPTVLPPIAVPGVGVDVAAEAVAVHDEAAAAEAPEAVAAAAAVAVVAAAVGLAILWNPPQQLPVLVVATLAASDDAPADVLGTRLPLTAPDEIAVAP